MNGSINFDGTLSGSIAGGGGGGGSEVTITPVITEGTKIADYSIDGAAGELYAPEAGDTVEVTPTLNVGDKVADIKVNGVNKALYSQSYGYANDMHDTNSETIGGFQKGSNITPVKVKAVTYADQAGADGETIGVLSVGDTDYEVKQKKANIIVDNNEKVIGTWFGENLYEKTLVIHNESTVNSRMTIATIDSTFRVKNWEAFVIESGVTYKIPYVAGSGNASFIFRENGNVELIINNTSFSAGSDFYITIEYTKEV